MRCPNCGSLDTQVKDSRPTEDSAAIRRRRVCLACNFRFTTFERVQLRELVVIKRNGRRVPFDRDKLMRSVQVALRKRNIEPERVEQFVSRIVRELESLGESEVSSETIGEMVMEHLRTLEDARLMGVALVLGRRGLGRTWPNPAVGAVIVKDGVILGRGWTQPGGRPHAETEALNAAGPAAKGATLYTTLEPCSHHGKTP